jgi:hypothetical protein
MANRISFTLLAALLPLSAFSQPFGRLTSVSAELYPTLFFGGYQASSFEALPYEVVEIEVLSASQARTRGFLPKQLDSSSENPFTGMVIVESWERFEVLRGQGFGGFMDAVAKGETLKLKNISLAAPDTFTLLKVGVAFRAIVAVSVPATTGASLMAAAQTALRSGAQVWARVEVVGIGSPEMTKSLPGVYNLLSGETGVSQFVNDTTEARKNVWGSFGQLAVRPKPQVLGWIFPQASQSPSYP